MENMKVCFSAVAEESEGYIENLIYGEKTSDLSFPLVKEHLFQSHLVLFLKKFFKCVRYFWDTSYFRARPGGYKIDALLQNVSNSKSLWGKATIKLLNQAR